MLDFKKITKILNLILLILTTNGPLPKKPKNSKSRPKNKKPKIEFTLHKGQIAKSRIIAQLAARKTKFNEKNLTLKIKSNYKYKTYIFPARAASDRGHGRRSRMSGKRGHKGNRGKPGGRVPRLVNTKH